MLLKSHPEIQVQSASFPRLKGKMTRMSYWGQAKNHEAKPIGFYAILQQEYEDAICKDAKFCDSKAAVMPVVFEGF